MKFFESKGFKVTVSLCGVIAAIGALLTNTKDCVKEITAE